ncbi:hypothetical protein [Pseudomonas umsongensis]|uniref:hypothetical protein n=1 Tax=Pseudomonas umsongensis TaxID=198618 RepID=UPI0015A59D51|nr:hypothetical protein [Pseudomonas umsongensis]
MDWLQFFSSIVASIAWPAAVVMLACLMRNPLAKLIPLIRTLKYKDLQIDIGEQLEAVREQVGAEGETPEIVTQEPPLSFQSLAKADPRAAVLSAWIPVEIELNDIARKMGFEASSAIRRPMIPINMIRYLFEQNLVDRLTYETLEKLRRIRNTAVHVTEASVTFEDAINMADMCQWVNGQLKRINASLNESQPSDPAL